MLKKDSADKSGWAWSILIVALCTGVAVLTFRYFELVDIAMIYLLGSTPPAGRQNVPHFWLRS
jgi:hypothetical protein